MEGAGAFGRDGDKGQVGQVGVNLIGLAHGAASDEFADEGGHAGPPIVLVEERNSVEISTMGRECWAGLGM